MPEQLLDLKLEDNIMHITMVRGDIGNTFGVNLAKELSQALDFAQDAQPSVIVLSATGRFFCAGGDLQEFSEAEDPSAFTTDLADQLAGIVRRLQAMPAIVVAVIRGIAAGAGVPLAAAADIIVASESASFTFAYTRAGLSPDGGGTLLTQSVGLHRLLGWALLNPSISAKEAHLAGLVTEVVEDADLEARVGQIVRTLSSGSSRAHAETKRLIRQSVPTPAEHFNDEARTIGALAGSPDGQEGIGAFLEKRVPVFPTK